MQAAKLLTVGKGGVAAHYDRHRLCTGYVGHDWTDDVDEHTVVIDSRGVPDDAHWRLAVCGPMPGVDVPPGMVERVYGGLVPWEDTGGNGNARSLDSVAVDVLALLYRRAGAVVVQGAEGLALARAVSGRAQA